MSRDDEIHETHICLEKESNGHTNNESNEGVASLANGHACRIDHVEMARKDADNWKNDCKVSYHVEEVPPFALCILLGFQVDFFNL